MSLWDSLGINWSHKAKNYNSQHCSRKSLDSNSQLITISVNKQKNLSHCPKRNMSKSWMPTSRTIKRKSKRLMLSLSLKSSTWWLHSKKKLYKEALYFWQVPQGPSEKLQLKSSAILMVSSSKPFQTFVTPLWSNSTKTSKAYSNWQEERINKWCFTSNSTSWERISFTKS